MMKQTTISLFLGFMVTLLLSGCGIKAEMSLAYGQEKVMANETVIARLIVIEGSEAWRSPSDGYNKATRNIHVLQNAADATLNEGYKYFSFALPKDLAEGSMINTAEEYIKQCAPSSLMILTIGNNKCGFAVSDYVKVPAAIYAFKEQPKHFLTYNATEVKDYLIKTEQYRKDSYKKVQQLNHDSLKMLSPDLYGVMVY